MERIGGSQVWSRTNATEKMSSAELIKNYSILFDSLKSVPVLWWAAKVRPGE